MTVTENLERLSFILTNEEMKRITVPKDEQNDGIQTLSLDVHQLKTENTKRLIRKVINIIRDAFRLTIIHGYNNGTKTIEMLDKVTISDRVYMKEKDPFNIGVTNLYVRSIA